MSILLGPGVVSLLGSGERERSLPGLCRAESRGSDRPPLLSSFRCAVFRFGMPRYHPGSLVHATRALSDPDTRRAGVGCRRPFRPGALSASSRRGGQARRPEPQAGYALGVSTVLPQFRLAVGRRGVGGVGKYRSAAPSHTPMPCGSTSAMARGVACRLRHVPPSRCSCWCIVAPGISRPKQLRPQLASSAHCGRLRRKQIRRLPHTDPPPRWTGRGWSGVNSARWPFALTRENGPGLVVGAGRFKNLWR